LPEPSPALSQAYSAATRLVRQLDPDRALACLFAPREKQPHLFALYAFSAEIARIREVVSEPLPGEIRQQWWRDALTHPGEAGHDVAIALRHTMARFNLPPEPFLAVIEARSFDLYDDPMPTWVDLEGYCGETASALIRLASLILAGGDEPGSAALCGHAGVAYALTGLLRAFPLHARQGRCFIPQELLTTCGVSLESLYRGEESAGLHAALAEMRARARHHLAIMRAERGAIDKRIAPAFYPVCLCPAYLDAMEKRGFSPFETLITLSPLRKFWLIGKAAWFAR